MALVPNRTALQDISRSPYTMRASSETNLVIIPESFLTPSPEEQIIRQRGRKLIMDASSLDYNTPTIQAKETQSLSRKRLLLNMSSDSDSPQMKKLHQVEGASLVPLRRELCAYTPQQLADVIDRLVKNHPHLEQEVRSSLPLPDLVPLEERLSSLRRDIYRALPSPRCGGHTRDATCYRHVRIHIDAFKRACVEQGRLLLAAECWLGLVQYSCIASRLASRLPVWEATAHNRPRQHCLRLLAAQCLLGLRRGHYQKDELLNILVKLRAAVTYNPELQTSMDDVHQQLMKQPDT